MYNYVFLIRKVDISGSVKKQMKFIIWPFFQPPAYHFLQKKADTLQPPGKPQATINSNFHSTFSS